MDMTDHSAFYYSDEGRKHAYLFEKIQQLGYADDNGKQGLFYDMLFEEGSSTFHLLGHDILLDQETNILPNQLTYFTYSFFKFIIDEGNSTIRGNKVSYGYFDQTTQTLGIYKDCLQMENVILHEMIHLHEYVIQDCSQYYHDILLRQLYKDLKNGCIETKLQKISGLDQMLDTFSQVAWYKYMIQNMGGEHSMLFLLKSLKLDLQMNYQLGTVFGYDFATQSLFNNLTIL